MPTRLSEGDVAVLLCKQIDDILVGHKEYDVLSALWSYTAHIITGAVLEQPGNRKDYMLMRVNEASLNIRGMIEANLGEKNANPDK